MRPEAKQKAPSNGGAEPSVGPDRGLGGLCEAPQTKETR